MSGIADKNCSLCPRLAEFISVNRGLYPNFYNGSVPSFGDVNGRLLIVGLAPGLKGANRTGRPFTGDYAGELLYSTLLEFGFAKGDYKASPDDGLELTDCRITNAVRCVPPQNKVTGEEIKNCNFNLKAEIAGMPELKIVMALGTVAHGAVLSGFDLRKSAFPFVHGKLYQGIANNISLIDCYHCSRYNTNTGVLTEEMFKEVFISIKEEIFS